jgi:hypothetical protein
MSSALNRLLERLDRARQTPTGYMARCSAHEDAEQSLWVAAGDDRRTLTEHAR